METRSPAKRSSEAVGMLSGLAAYSLWGLFPLYWKSLSAVSALQILAHRVVWAFLFTSILTVVFKKTQMVIELFHDTKRLAATLGAGVLVTANWGIYIWAVNSGHITQSSLGYYLNPLVSVVLGALVLREKIDRGMLAATIIAAVGIAILTISIGELPWISLTLAATFALYGLIKKIAHLDTMVGLAMETAPVAPIAVAYLIMQNGAGLGAFVHDGFLATALLVIAGPVTAIPLMFYAEGVKRVAFSRIGFLQYISPTLQLSLGLFGYGEKLNAPQAVAFGFVLAALLVFALSRKGVSRR